MTIQPVFPDRETFLDNLAKGLTNNPRATRNALNVLRKQQVSSVKYTSAGAVTFQFFTNGMGDTNKERDSIPVAGKFQNHIIIHGIAATYHIQDCKVDAFTGDDATTLVSDIVAGVFQAGVFSFSNAGDRLLTVPRPFLQMPLRAGAPQVKSAGIKTLTLVEAAPNTYPGTVVTPVPHATLGNDDPNAYELDPKWFIPLGAPFEMKIEYPSGALAPIASTVIHDSTNPLYIQLVLDTEEISIR